MAVCKFYRQGNCKFGNNCKFEHPPNLAPSQPALPQSNSQRGPQGSNRTNGFSQSYQNNPQNQRGGPPRDHRDNRDPKDAPYGVTRKTLEEDLRNERPLWIMSAYGPGKDADIQLFGGFPLEQSPEEIRTLHYQALAAGNLQQSIQMEAELAAKANDQTQAVLNDVNGALKYLGNGPNEHPNRNDICKAGTVQLGRNEHPYFSVASARYRQRNAQRSEGLTQNAPTAFSGNGPSAIGFGQPVQSSSQPNTFGQGSTGGFGTQLQAGFGVAPAPQNQPQFSQNNPLFGQNNPSFGQQSNDIGFGQPQPQPQPTEFAGFQQQQPPQNIPTFDAQMNQAPASQQGAGGFFGQLQQPQAPLVQPMTNGFQPSQQQHPQSGGFGGTAQQVAANGDVQSYTTRDSSNKLLTWKGRPVNYMNGDQPCYRRDDGTWERIWFPNGSPAAAASTNTGVAGALEFSENIKAAYAALKDEGQFNGGIVPEVAPSVDLVRWDV